MSTIETPSYYVTEHRPNGLSVYLYHGGHAGLIHESIMLGHRLAAEGKEIVETRVWETYSTERAQQELSIECRIKHKLKS